MTTSTLKMLEKISSIQDRSLQRKSQITVDSLKTIVKRIGICVETSSCAVLDRDVMLASQAQVTGYEIVNSWLRALKDGCQTVPESYLDSEMTK